jgi:hypothetical protein
MLEYSLKYSECSQVGRTLLIREGLNAFCGTECVEEGDDVDNEEEYDFISLHVDAM